MGRLYGEFWQIDKQTNKKLRKFKTTKEAANWLIENDGLDKSIRSISHYLAECLINKYSSGYGYKWKLDLEDLPNEIWKEVPFLKDVYVSTEGRIKYERQITYGSNGTTNAQGIPYKEIRFDRKSYRVNCLIGKTFLPNFYGKTQVNHKDGNPQNNRLYNLEWTTAKENSEHAYETGLNPKQKKVKQYTLDGEFIKEYRSTRLASRETSISNGSISKCCNGDQNYSHAGGFLWRYE